MVHFIGFLTLRLLKRAAGDVGAVLQFRTFYKIHRQRAAGWKVQEKCDRPIADGLVPAELWGEPVDIGCIAAGLGLHSGSIIKADGALSVARLGSADRRSTGPN